MGTWIVISLGECRQGPFIDRQNPYRFQFHSKERNDRVLILDRLDGLDRVEVDIY